MTFAFLHALADQWYLIANLVVLAILAHWCWPAIEAIYFWDQVDERQGQHMGHWAFEEARQVGQELAVRRLVRGVMTGGLALAYLHVYAAQCATLVAHRTAARSQPPPYGCEGNNQRWEDLTVAQQAKITLSGLIGPSTETACSTYLDHVTANVWANPLIVYPLLVGAADALGDALDKFLGHHSFFIQLALILFSVALLLFLIQCSPPAIAAIQRKQSRAPRIKSAPPLALIDEEEGCLITAVPD